MGCLSSINKEENKFEIDTENSESRLPEGIIRKITTLKKLNLERILNVKSSVADELSKYNIFNESNINENSSKFMCIFLIDSNVYHKHSEGIRRITKIILLDFSYFLKKNLKNEKDAIAVRALMYSNKGIGSSVGEFTGYSEDFEKFISSSSENLDTQSGLKGEVDALNKIMSFENTSNRDVFMFHLAQVYEDDVNDYSKDLVNLREYDVHYELVHFSECNENFEEKVGQYREISSLKVTV